MGASFQSRTHPNERSPARSAAEVESELKPMSIPSLLQISFRQQKERNLRWNDIRYEFLLSFLDVSDWYRHNSHDIDNPHTEANRLGAAKSHLCGLLHICFMAWEGGAKHPYNDGKGDTYLNFWLRSAPEDAKDNIRHALKFSQKELQEHKDEYTQLCVDWLRHLGAGFTMKQEDHVQKRYSQAFGHMHSFVCLHSQISNLKGAD